MKRFILFLLVLIAAPLQAQVYKPPVDDSIYCQLWPDTCKPSEPFRRVIPIPRLDVNRRVGITQVGNDCGYNGQWPNGCYRSNVEIALKASEMGLHSIQLWPMDTDDLFDALRVPGIDTFVIRPMQWSFKETTCNGSGAATWEDWMGIRLYLIDRLFKEAGDLDIDVIITNWEGDWQIVGPRCSYPDDCIRGGIWPDWYDTSCYEIRKIRADWMKNEFEKTQALIDEYESIYPDVKIDVYFMVVANHTEEEYDVNIARDVVPNMDPQPDFVGLSHWDKDQTIIQALVYIKENTGYARYRIIVAEVGGPNFYEQAKEALDWGVEQLYGWQLYDFADDKWGFIDHETDTWTQNMYDLVSLREEYEN